MVLKYSDRGFPYHEPPYTLEEEREFYRRTASVKKLTRPEPRDRDRPKDLKSKP